MGTPTLVAPPLVRNVPSRLNVELFPAVSTEPAPFTVKLPEWVSVPLNVLLPRLW